MTPRQRRLGAALLAAAAAATASCGGREVPAGPTPRHVVLVSIDTLRADGLGSYGAVDARTETLDRLAAEGVRFDAAIAPSPVTLPSHAALLTGIRPWRLGIFHNGIYRLDPGFDSLAERLGEAGFETAAVIGGYPLSAFSGIDQGFATYDDAIPLPEEAEYYNPERRAREVTDAAIAWLDGRDPGRRLFLFVHYYDPHAPYDPPGAYLSAPVSPDTAGPEDLRRAYAGEIAYVDDQIDRLVTALRDRTLLDDTLLVVTSDHGEGLMDHDELTHGVFLYDEVVRVPLIARYPPSIPAGRVVETTVGLVDVTPTVLAAVGLAGDDVLDGRSLWPVLRESGTEPRAVFSESRVGQLEYGWAPLRSVRHEAWKYIDAPMPELYALERDPGERTNVVDANPDRAADMLAEIEAAFRAPVPGSGGELTEEELERLRSLGYLQHGDAGAPPAPNGSAAPGPDPKGRVRQLMQFHLASGEMAMGRFREAEDRLARLAAADPTNVTARCRLADARLARGDHAGAMQALREALAVARERGRAQVLWRMAGVERARGNPERALAYYREHADIAPPSGRSVQRRAETLTEAGRPDEAVALVRAWLVEQPGSLLGHRTLARLLDAAGRPDDAAASWRRVLELRPGDPEAAGALR